MNKLITLLLKWNLKPRERLLATGFGVVALVVLLDLAVLQPWIRQGQKMRHEIQQLEETLYRRERLLSRRQEVLTELSGYQRYLKPILADELQTAGLLKEIEELAEKSSVLLAEIKPLPAQTEGSSKRYSFDVQFECTLESWVDFVVGIESSPSLFQVLRASMATQEETPDKLKASLRVVGSAFMPAAEGESS